MHIDSPDQIVGLPHAVPRLNFSADRGAGQDVLWRPGEGSDHMPHSKDLQGALRGIGKKDAAATFHKAADEIIYQGIENRVEPGSDAYQSQYTAWPFEYWSRHQSCVSFTGTSRVVIIPKEIARFVVGCRAAAFDVRDMWGDQVLPKRVCRHNAA